MKAIKFPKKKLYCINKSFFLCLPILWIRMQEFQKGNFIEASITSEGNLLVRKYNAKTD